MNPDLKKERDNSKVNVTKLTEFLGKCLFGSIERFEKFNFLREKLVERVKPLFYENYENLDRSDKYEINLKKSLEMIEFARENGLNDNMEYTYLIGAVMGNEKQVFGLHFSMFSISIDLWSTVEQRNYWKSFMEKNTVFGTYIQTEMGHGTFVRGLETTATYDKSSDEFVINSPSLTATKFWPGSSGKTCNFCVLMAELIIDGKKFGIHAFVVQLRSLEDHLPMKGIEIGDIGKKYGYDPIDNGYVMFKNYRIPRNNMLMRFSQVSSDGQFKRVGNEQIMYACMLIMRSIMCMFASLLLSMSTTIAVRYSCVRRQTADSNGIEPQIIEYQTQQSRILSGLATTYAFIFATTKFRNITNSLQTKTNYFQNIQQNDLARLHAISSGLKAVIFDESLKFAHSNRQCCGGHGYSLSSGLPAIIHEADAGCTYEGDNIILLLQTARYLLKCAQKNISPHLGLPKFDEIKTCEIYQRFEPILSCFERLFDGLLGKLSDRMVKLISDGLNEYEAWNNSTVLLTQLSKIYIYIFINNAFLSYLYSHLKESQASNQQALVELFDLYLHYSIVELNSVWLMRLGIISGEDMKNYQDRYFKLLTTVRKDAVCLVDSFNWSDAHLSSTLGAYDGNVYERLFEFAKNSKINLEAENYGWYKNYISHKSKL